MLIKRSKIHFHRLPCNATVILGSNGYVFVGPHYTAETQVSVLTLFIKIWRSLIRGVKTVEGNDESLYCHDNLIIPLIKRGMMSDYAHVNHASVSVYNH